MKNLPKKDIDWLWKAIRNKLPDDVIAIQDDCAIATDGYRMHTINSLDLPDIINNFHVGDVLKIFDEGEIKTRFVINSQFLIDALSIFQNEVHIILIQNSNIEGIIVNSDNETDKDKEAFVMCIKRTSVRLK
jgi:hypothetical protein